MKIKSSINGVVTAVAVLSSFPTMGASLGIEEVVVTGTKRSVSQQDLGASITTITTTQIENTFQTDVTALTQLAPNVTISKQPGFNAIAGGIRGTGNISILVTTDPSVGLTVDEFALNHIQSQFVELFDVEQIEVFRGPQGTLFGKNTSAGAINITSKKPVLNEFNGDIGASFSQFDSNDSNASKINLALNVPLIEDKLAARLAVIKDDADGYYTNNKPNGGVVGDGRDLGGIDVLAAKLKFLFTPNDIYEALLTFEYVDDTSSAPAVVNDTPTGEGYVWPSLGFPGITQAGVTDPFSTGESSLAIPAIDIPGGHQIETTGIYLNQKMMIGNFSLSSITGVRNSEEILASTYTGDAYTSLYDASRNSKRDMFQQEFRLVSEFDGPFNFVAGAAYYQDDVDFIVFGRLGFLSFFTGDPFYNNALQIQATTQERESYAVYFDASYDLTENTTLSGGLRYSNDEKSFTRQDGGSASNPLSNYVLDSAYRGPFTNPIPDSEFGLNIAVDAEFSKTTFRALLEHNLTDDLLLYGTVSSGFVAGGFAETCGSVTSCRPYNSETSLNYEVGFKGDFLDNSLRLNASLFSVDYEDLIRSQVVEVKDASGNSFQETRIVNNGKSKAQGIEIEATWAPSDSFRIDMNMGYIDHKYKEYSPNLDVSTLGGPTGTAAIVDLSSLDVPFSPKFNMGVSATYDQSLANDASLTYNLNVHKQDKAETQPFPANFQGKDSSGNYIIKPKANTDIEARTLLNGSITYHSSDDAYSLSLYGKNLTNEKHRASGNAVATLWVFTRYSAPRELGVKLGYHF